jgi:putative membrane protein
MDRQLTTDEKARIQAAVAAAEARTHVHVAVSIVPASDRYLLYPLVWAAVAALVAGGILAFVWPHLALSEGFAAEAIIFVVLSFLLDWWPLRLLLVPRHIRERNAQALAHREFAARVLASHERKGGVLFFVSLGERYAEILADGDTHERVGATQWNHIVADYVDSAQRGRVADGIVAAVAACSAVL